MFDPINGYGVNRVSKLRVYVQKVLPLVYDDSLSYYELLNRVVEKVNEVIEFVNDDLVKEIDELVKEYYVNITYNKSLERINLAVTSEDSTDSDDIDSGDVVSSFKVNNRIIAVRDSTVDGKIKTAVDAESAETNVKLNNEKASRIEGDKSINDALNDVDENLRLMIVTEQQHRIEKDTEITTRINTVIDNFGSPLTSNTLAGMTDTDKIYVYVGNESGMVNGNWYYYNGTEWVSGGTYNSSAVLTDKTLTVENVPADAKVVGNRTLRYVSQSNYTTALEMEVNTYIQHLGSALRGTLGDNFDFTLYDNTSYRLERFALFTLPVAGVTTQTHGYRLYDIAGRWQFGGYFIVGSSDDITWFRINTNNNEMQNYLTDINTKLDSRTLKYVPIANYSLAINMENNTYTAALGSALMGTLGDNFTWTLENNRTYRLERYPLYTTDAGTSSTSICYRLTDIAGIYNWGGYLISGQDNIRWYYTSAYINSKAIFCGTSIMYGQTEGGGRSVYNLPSMYAKKTGMQCTNSGVRGQGLIKDWAEIYGSSSASDGYTFDNAKLGVFNWFENDGTAWNSMNLGTGADSEGTTTILGYYNTFIKKLLINYPNMTQVWISSRGVWSGTHPQYNASYSGADTSFTMNDLCEGVKNLCKKYRIGFVDLRENNPLNIYNYTDLLLEDLVHFTDEGNKKYSEICIAGIGKFFEAIE